MSRVYTEKVITDVCQGTIAYVWAFNGAIASTRIPLAIAPGPGSTLLDLFVNYFGLEDPYTAEELAITRAWSTAGPNKWGPEDSQLHVIPLSFKAAWPPPQKWVVTVDWNPLSQNSARKRRFGHYRSRKSGASSGE